jgi:hypothetical protein
MDLNELQLDSYEAICQLPLEVGFYAGPRYEKFATALKVYMEGTVNWHIKSFPNLDHMAGILASWTPDILITHWHGENYFLDWNDDGPKDSHSPTRIVTEYHKKRGGKRIGKGPFLVGQYSPMDEKFMGPGGGWTITSMLKSHYDMLYERPFDLGGEQGLEIVPWNVAIGLWNVLLSQEKRVGHKDVPFDPLFQGHLLGQPFDGHHHFDDCEKLKQEQSSRHQERVYRCITRSDTD